MPKPRVRPGADQFVIFLDRDSRAPILSKMPARPQCKRDPSPGKHYSRDRKSIGAMDDSLAEKANLCLIHKQQREARNFKEKNAITRSKRFGPGCTPGLERAHRPVSDEDDPRCFDEIAPMHFFP